MKSLLNLIYLDIGNLKFMPITDEKNSYITFIDDWTRECYTYLIMNKDEAIERFKNYKNKVENRLNMKIKVIKNDRGGEYEALVDEFCF